MTFELRTPQLVFVYGSLKKGFSNAILLGRPEDAMHCGEYTTRNAAYKMHSYGGFPAVVRANTSKGYHIKGEVYLVTSSMLKQLDRLEGCPTWYERKRVFLDDGSLVWMYILPHSEGLPLVPIDEDNNSQEWVMAGTSIARSDEKKGIRNVNTI